MSVTPPSSWPWVDHPVSGLRHVTKSPCSDSLSLRLPYSVKLATQRKSLTHYTKGTPSSRPCLALDEPSKAVCRRFALPANRRHPLLSFTRRPSHRASGGSFHLGALPRALTRARRKNPDETGSISSWSLLPRALTRARRKNPDESQPRAGLRLFVCMRFQDLFHSPPGVLFAFPSRYWFTIGRSRVFSLGGWSPHLQTGFHVSRPTCLAPGSTLISSVTGLSPTAAALSRAFS